MDERSRYCDSQKSRTVNEYENCELTVMAQIL